MENTLRDAAGRNNKPRKSGACYECEIQEEMVGKLEGDLYLLEVKVDVRIVTGLVPVEKESEL